MKIDVNAEDLQNASSFVHKIGGEIDGEINALKGYVTNLFAVGWREGGGARAAQGECEKLDRAARLVNEAINSLGVKIGKAGISYTEQDQAVKSMFPDGTLV